MSSQGSRRVLSTQGSRRSTSSRFPQEDAMGGWKKRGGWKTSRMTPLPKRGTFSTPLRCQCSVFPVQKSTTEQTRSSFGGVQKFSGERVLWYVFLLLCVLHPPISRPKFPKPWSLEHVAIPGKISTCSRSFPERASVGRTPKVKTFISCYRTPGPQKGSRGSRSGS